MGSGHNFWEYLAAPAGYGVFYGPKIWKDKKGADIPDQSPLPLPEPVDTAATADKAAENIKRRKAQLTKTIYTNPLGLQGEAEVARKTLLGQ